MIDLVEAKRRLPLPDLMGKLGLGDHAKKTAGCPWPDNHRNGDRNPSFGILHHNNGWGWKCHAGCGGGDEVAFLAKWCGLSLGEAIAKYGELAGLPDVSPQGSKSSPEESRLPATEVATYDYTDENGNLLYQVVRYEPKSFRQRRPDGKGGWIWNLNGVKRVLYRLPEVRLAVSRKRTLYVVEGEKDVDAVVKFGFCATCNSGGAGKWSDSYSDILRGADIVIVPDKDRVGRDHAHDVAQALQGVAASVRVMELPGDGKDISDWLTSGGGAPELTVLTDQAVRFKPDQHSQGGIAPLRVYYDERHKTYWLQDSEGRWIEITETSLRRHLRAAGVSARCTDDEPLSRVDQTLVRVQLDHHVAYAGPLAGSREGLLQMAGHNVLVIDSPRLIQPVRGDCPLIEKLLEGLFDDPFGDQRPYFLGWMKVAIEALRAGRHRPGQAIVIAGPHDCGKSLLQNLITDLLGGRSAKPYRYMSGQTPFNGDLFGAEHLVIEDELASTDLRARRAFGSHIKSMTVTEFVSCHAKNRQAITLKPFWRLTISLNDEPENLMILPPLDESLVDKIMLLRAQKRAMPMRTLTLDDRDKYWSALSAELPAFVFHLLHYQLPDNLKSERFGVKHFHHPDLVREIDALAPEARLLGIIDAVLFDSPAAPNWVGTAQELERRLVASTDFGYEAKRLLDWGFATGTYLGRLARKLPGRVTTRRTEKRREWQILTP